MVSRIRRTVSVQADSPRPDTGRVPLRPASEVMDLERLGSLHPCRLSFIRTLMRKVMAERWAIQRERFDLDDNGYGTCIYRVASPTRIYNLVIFSQHLDPDARSDRVIANAWDVAFALCLGDVDDSYIERLRENVPRQEAGRCDPRVMVLSRANRSLRNFDSTVEALSRGHQPDADQLARVGYLYRTTAVYGNGKFGIADYPRIRELEDFGLPFSAQMFAVYLLRDFSIRQVEHIARCRSPETAVGLHPDLQRYLGIGNSTGLGMAPFLINHPQLINQWLLMRESALARCLGEVPNRETRERMIGLIDHTIAHNAETFTDDPRQSACNAQLGAELQEARDWLAQTAIPEVMLWQALLDWSRAYCSLETQELLNSLMLEIYPERVDELEQSMGASESQDLVPEMGTDDLLARLRRDYDWALNYDFDDAEQTHLFWYRSAEKEEPRLGERGVDAGDEWEMGLDVARQTRELYDALLDWRATQERSTPLVEFLLAHPRFKGIARRVQTLSEHAFGDIRANLLAQGTLPIHLLRCKLAFFGATKFDPRSDRWVRITLFQGAPRIEDIGQHFADDWWMPLKPELGGER
ncbi:hypothetical protein V6X02_05445 [Spiribacter sp. 1M153]|uniref:Zorya protein ZorC EH domain-containing protein n=1 Tax=Spiribacter roseus TaxID=1855875 RepID=A0ABV3RYN0_9GAMM|nr:hypothetical protein [Spiribacter sp. SSL99]